MELLSILIVFAGLFVAWNIGANDASNAIGTTVGSGIMPFQRAVLIVIVFSLLGASLEGYKVMATVGKGIVPAVDCTTDDPCRAMNAAYACSKPAGAPTNATGVCASTVTNEPVYYLEKDPRAVLAAFLAAGAFLLWITASLKLPTSTTQSIVGAVAGAGLGLGLFGGMRTPINYAVLGKMLGSWIASPIGAAIIAFVLYHVLYRTLPRIGGQGERAVKALTVVAAVFVAYNLGANDVANAVGPLVGANALGGYEHEWRIGSHEASHITVDLRVLPALLGALMGGLALGLGAIMLGRGVVETMGGGITPLGPVSALAAQLASAITVYLFVHQGIPVSTTQAIVGGVIGVGLTKGVRTVNFGTIRNIMLGWVATPLASGIIAIGLYYLLWLVLPL